MIGATRFSMKKSAIVLISVLASLWFFSSEVLQAETIKGNVRYVGAPIEKKKISVTIDQYICGKEKDPEDLLLSGNNGIKNAVVSLQNIAPEAKRDWNLPPAKMDQKQCSFTPRVVIVPRSEEHTSELQSRRDLVCRLLLEKKKKKRKK